jgi:hypothetical protein
VIVRTRVLSFSEVHLGTSIQVRVVEVAEIAMIVSAEANGMEVASEQFVWGKNAKSGMSVQVPETTRLSESQHMVFLLDSVTFHAMYLGVW